MQFFVTWALETWDVILDAAPWLLGGFALAGILHVLLSVQIVSRYVGRPGWASTLKAAIVGLPLPICSCGVIPIASALRRHGAARGPTVSFLVSVPQAGVSSIAISYPLLGPFMAAARVVAALITAVTAGIVVDWLGVSKRERDSSPQPLPSVDPDTVASPSATTPACCTANAAAQGGDAPIVTPSTAPEEPVSNCCATVALPSAGGRLVTKSRDALHYGFITMFEDLAGWLILGFALAGLIGAVVPENFFEHHIGTGIGAMVLMLLVGLPMYVCATSSTPVAALLIAKGLSPGAALVFLLAGPATNAAAMVIVGRDLGRRSLVVYLVTIAIVAVLTGLITDQVIGAVPAFRESVDEHVHCPGETRMWPFGVAMLLLIVNGLFLRWTRGKPVE